MTIREAREEEHAALGALMVAVYSDLEGFPSPADQPGYYQLLAGVGALARRAHTRLLVAAEGEALLGGVVYLSDMADYGAGGAATEEPNSAGIRLLAVSPAARGKGVGKALTLRCLELARASGRRQVILHTTTAMKLAWGMYERLGFRRARELDFAQASLPVFGFRLVL